MHDRIALGGGMRGSITRSTKHLGTGLDAYLQPELQLAFNGSPGGGLPGSKIERYGTLQKWGQGE